MHACIQACVRVYEHVYTVATVWTWSSQNNFVKSVLAFPPSGCLTFPHSFKNSTSSGLSSKSLYLLVDQTTLKLREFCFWDSDSLFYKIIFPYHHQDIPLQSGALFLFCLLFEVCTLGQEPPFCPKNRVRPRGQKVSGVRRKAAWRSRIGLASRWYFSH